jgi:hypothetical protein
MTVACRAKWHSRSPAGGDSGVAAIRTARVQRWVQVREARARSGSPRLTPCQAGGCAAGVAGDPRRTTSGRCIAGDLGSQGSPRRRRCSGGPSRTALRRDSANHLTARQQAVFDVIAARPPRPVTSTQLATELQFAAGTLNVTLRSLQRRQLIAAVNSREGRGMDALALAINGNRRHPRSLEPRGRLCVAPVSSLGCAPGGCERFGRVPAHASRRCQAPPLPRTRACSRAGPRGPAGVRRAAAHPCAATRSVQHCRASVPGDALQAPPMPYPTTRNRQARRLSLPGTGTAADQAEPAMFETAAPARR